MNLDIADFNRIYAIPETKEFR